MHAALSESGHEAAACFIYLSSASQSSATIPMGCTYQAFNGTDVQKPGLHVETGHFFFFFFLFNGYVYALCIIFYNIFFIYLSDLSVIL